MRVDQARSDDPPGQRDVLTRIVARSGWMHAGYQWADQTDIGSPQFTGCHIGDHTAGHSTIELLLAACRTNRAITQRGT